MSSDLPQGSVTRWISRLNASDTQVFHQLWERYAEKLCDLVRRTPAGAGLPHGEEEDVVVSVFASLHRAAAAGRLGDISSRHELWWLLLAIAQRKAIDRVRRGAAQKRGNGCIRVESDLYSQEHRFSFQDLISAEPDPVLVAIFHEEEQRLLLKLRNEELRRIAAWRIEGHSVSEMAEKLGITARSVRRKLELIRETWALESSDSPQ